MTSSPEAAPAPQPKRPGFVRLCAVTALRLVPFLFIGEVLATLLRMALAISAPLASMAILYMALVSLGLLLARHKWLSRYLPLVPIVTPRAGALLSILAWATCTSMMSLLRPSPTPWDILSALLLTILCLATMGEVYAIRAARPPAAST